VATRRVPRSADSVRPGSRTDGRAGSYADGSPSIRETLRWPVAAGALLPLRLFLGITFLYAGVDKLSDPNFFNASSALGIAAQLKAFTHTSPLSPLIQAFAVPFPDVMGALIALGEIAVGIGVLTGILFRLAALGGFALSTLFFLTVSWNAHPYYYGQDLPYAMAWLTLALAGTGEVLVLGPWLAARVPALRPAAPVRGRAPSAESGMLTRRHVLEVMLLGAASIIAAVFAGTVGRFVREQRDRGELAQVRGQASAAPSVGGGDASAAPGATAGASATAASAPPAATATPGAAAGGTVIARVSDLSSTPAVGFTIPSSGDPGILIRLSSGKFVAYDAVCTHQGCQVGYDPSQNLIVCPCHGAEYDPANNAAVVAGPAPLPLTAVAIKVDQASGQITATS
jgi:thiosulfate dehydrogenase (quinone) large subunit